ncbi:MAG: hypothetical protein U5R48_01450 [Gammaproteobacteria bacterium]|nr:hypothetical protein [Gammaproteobacteria bacterium]
MAAGRAVEGAYRVVIRNGVVDTESSVLPDQKGVDIQRFADLDEVTAQSVGERLGSPASTARPTQIAALNTARIEDGLLIRIGRGHQRRTSRS